LSSHAVPLLGKLTYYFPEGTQAIGRLDKAFRRLATAHHQQTHHQVVVRRQHPHTRSYLVQVKYEVPDEKFALLRAVIGISHTNDSMYTTQPCLVRRIAHPETDISHAHELQWYIPHSWLLITLSESKFLQVRKMVKGIGHPFKRLIRISIENLTLQGLEPGEVKEIREVECVEKHNIVL
jgi:23S rRNA pseudouridine2457 synthase